MDKNAVIGIDLGTTNSCVSIVRNGKTTILENYNGGRITPSFIFFDEIEGTIVGDHAKGMAVGKPERGIYEVKRLVGRKFKEWYIQNNLNYLPFKITEDSNGDPLVVVDKRTMKTPQQLCAIILQKLKKDVEAKLGCTITKTVITVPAYFNVRQREVTLAAAKEAGFTVLKLLNEPTAAALNYYFENDSEEISTSLVFDLGGGTFDVAILKRDSNNIEILGVDGDTQLGGHDFDNLISDYVCEELITNYDFDPRANKTNLRRLHTKCEDAKKALSTVQQFTMNLTGFVPNHPLVQVKLSRQQFETLADDLFRKAIRIVDECISRSGVDKSDIEEVILAGGSTRIPKIQEMLTEYFDGKNLNKFVNPDECVAEGAALQAAMLSKNKKQKISKIVLKDVVSLSLGTGVLGGEMSFVIKRNSPIPVNASSTYLTVENRQNTMTFEIFEGERPDISKNRLLGTITISDITPAPPGKCEIILSMNVDENGILTVTAKEKFKNNMKELKVDYTRGVNEGEAKASNFLEDSREDERFKNFAKHKRNVINYCVAINYNFEQKNLIEKHKTVHELNNKTKNLADKVGFDSEFIIVELLEKLKVSCEPLVRYYGFELMPRLE